MDPQQRYWLIELLAYWEGCVNTKPLITYFGISRQQASKDFKTYCQIAPNNIIYDSSARAYRPNSEFHRHYIQDDVSEYLNWMRSPTCQLHDQSINTSTPNLPNLSLEIPPRRVTPEIMRALITAIREHRRVEVDYVSLNNPNREGRIIVPHTFVSTGLRWHLRAWCEKSKDYRDFVLSRFRGTPDVQDKSDRTSDQDIAWNTPVTLILAPDQRLPPEKRNVLEHDYQMHSGQLHITTRACLVNYLLREMQVNTKMLDGTPEAQQLVLVNLADIKQWLFEG